MTRETLALDVYGTLINPHAIVTHLQEHLGDRAEEFSQLWRTKQLEYSFRRGLMKTYADFSVVTRDALEYTNQMLCGALNETAKRRLMYAYTQLDAYDEVPSALAKLRSKGHSLFAFSNGHPADLNNLLVYANLDNLLDGIVSVHEVRSYKPDPRVYAHFSQTTRTKPEYIRLVSSNSFDIAAAKANGWRTTWVRRDPNLVYDGWGPVPGTIVQSLLAI